MTARDLAVVCWYQFLERAINHQVLQSALAIPIETFMPTALEQRRPYHDMLYRLSDKLLTLWSAFRTFASIDGVKPTKDGSAQALRLKVLSGKRSFGACSTAGNR